MQLQITSILTVAVLLAQSAFAAPAPDANQPAKPVKPVVPTTVSQSNSCGNGGTQYCCNADSFGAFTTCSVLLEGSQCSSTTICCNADNSVQVCLGNAVIV